MEVTGLVTVLQAALSSDLAQRKAAEGQLSEFQRSAGYLPTLLSVIVRADVDVAIRQVGSIQFKNVLSRHWRTSRLQSSEGVPASGERIFSEEDMATVRENLMEALVCTPPQIRVQLGEALKSVVQSDYPEKWPSLIPHLQASLQSPDQTRVQSALLALRIIARKYEFKDEEEREPMNAVVATFLPSLLALLKHLMAIPSPTLEIAEYIKLILKIFWSSCYLEIPGLLKEEAVFVEWMGAFLLLVEAPVPAEGQPEDPEQRKNFGWWKVKKWTLHIVNRLYHRFGDPKYAKGDNKTFALMFEKNCTGRFLESYLKLLATLSSGGYLPERIINLSLQYLTYSITKKATYALMKPHLHSLLFEVVFPLLCFNASDEALWREDPTEYVRKGYDIIEDMYSARTAAINFIAELVTKRSKDNLDSFVASIVQILQKYEQAPPEAKPYREKDGALLALGALHEKLKRTDRYKAQLESMLSQHVFPEFKSSVGHLRAKAAWVAGQYADISFANAANFSGALHAIISALRDPDLPVRVDSVVALRSFIDACDDLTELRAILPQLLEEIFKLMHEVENEDLVFTLEVLVEKFGEEIAPFALGLVQNLTAVFWKCTKGKGKGDAAGGEVIDADADDDDDDAGALAAVGCLRAIATILESVSALPHLYPQMEVAILPILHRMLSSEGLDVYEEVLEIASYITFYGPGISPQMWSIWPLIMTAVDEFAIDYFDGILGPLDNLISRSTEHFLTCPDPNYPQSLFNMLSKVLNDEGQSDEDVVAAPKLMEVVLQNCRGRVDQWVEPYLMLALQRLRRAKNNHLKDLLIQVVANALYYNPLLTLSVLQKMGVVGEVFQAWLQMLYAQHPSKKPVHFKREHDKKVCVLGLTALLSLPPASLPAEVQSGLDQIVKALLKLLTALKTQKEVNEKEEEEDDNGEGIDDEGWEDGSDGEEGGEDAEDGDAESSKFKMLAQRAAQLMDDDDDDDDDFTDEEEFMTPIDAVDPFIFFTDAINSISVADPQRFQVLTSTFDFQHQAMAHAVATHAEEQRKKANEEEAKTS